MELTLSAILGVLALLSVIGAVVCLVHLHRTASDVDPLSGAVSYFGVGPHARWYRAQATLVGFGSLCVVWGLWGESVGGTVLLWLAVFGVSRLCIAWFPADLPERGRTRDGLVHNLLAAAAFASSAIAASDLGRVLRDTPGWDLSGPLAALGTAVVVTAIALGVTWLVPRLHRSVFGLVERFWYVAVLAWLSVASVALVMV